MSKVIVFLADGFEEIEAVTIIDVLRRADINVVTASIGSKTAVNGSHGISLHADILFTELTGKEDFDMAILPGGATGVENLSLHKDVTAFVKSVGERAWVAAICAAPSLLAQAGMLKNKNATAYPSFQSMLVQHGARYSEENICQHEKLITSRGPATAMEFALFIVEKLSGKESAKRVADAMLV